MKLVTWPQARLLDGVKQMDYATCLAAVVFNQPMWRERGNVGLCLSILDKCEDPTATETRFTEAELEALERCCQLPGLQVQPPAFNRFFLEVVAALQGAKALAPEA